MLEIHHQSTWMSVLTMNATIVSFLRRVNFSGLSIKGVVHNLIICDILKCLLPQYNSSKMTGFFLSCQFNPCCSSHSKADKGACCGQQLSWNYSVSPGAKSDPRLHQKRHRKSWWQSVARHQRTEEEGTHCRTQNARRAHDSPLWFQQCCSDRGEREPHGDKNQGPFTDTSTEKGGRILQSPGNCQFICVILLFELLFCDLRFICVLFHICWSDAINLYVSLSSVKSNELIDCHSGLPLIVCNRLKLLTAWLTFYPGLSMLTINTTFNSCT